MKNKTALWTFALIFLLVGGGFLYNALKGNAPNYSLPEFTNSSTKSTDITSQSSNGEQSKKEENSDGDLIIAPDFTVYDKDGNQVKLSDLRGKPVVLNFWASWCPPCKSEMPEFDNVFKELGNKVNFMMVDAVDGNRETVEKGKNYITKEGLSFPVYFDTNQDAVTKYGIGGFPTSIFIDKDGYIITGVEGAINEETLRKGIDLITEKTESQTVAEYHKISPEEAKEILDSDKEIILLDVRTDSEYDDGHIPNAKLVPDYEIKEYAENEFTDKNVMILLYCRSGRRSAESAKILVDMGYINVYDFGGIIDWPYEIVKK